MKRLVLRSFFFINLLPKVFVNNFLSLSPVPLYFLKKLCVLTVTSEDVCFNIRNVKFILIFLKPCIRYLQIMFVTAICFLFLLKLKWPRNKTSIYDLNYGVVVLGPVGHWSQVTHSHRPHLRKQVTGNMWYRSQVTGNRMFLFRFII